MRKKKARLFASTVWIFDLRKFLKYEIDMPKRWYLQRMLD